MATAVLLTGSEHARPLSWNARGMRGVRVYRVDATEEADVVAADGLPLLGDGWSGDFPLLAAVHFELLYEAGDYTLVTVAYETPGGGGRLEPRPEANLAYTERAYSEQVVNVKYGVEGGGVGTHTLDVPIAGGNGAPKIVIGTRLKVVVWRAVADYDPADDLALELMQGKVVENELELPPIYGTAVNMVYNEQTLLYLYSEARGEAGLVRIEHNFEARADHWVRWFKEDDKGLAVGTQEVTEVYDLVEFPQAALS